MARHSRKHSRRHKMRGGSYSSASSYGEYVNGNAGAQFNRVFDQGGAYGKIPGNVIIGAQGQNVDSRSQMPTQSQLNLVQNGGRRHKKNRRSRKGGFLGEVINQAIVPFALVGMQNTYRRKKGGRNRRTRRRGRR